MANIVDIEVVVIYGRQNVRNGPVNHLLIEVVYLRRNIFRQIPGVLEIDGPHNDFQLLYRLLINDVSLRLASIKDFLAYSVLEEFHVVGGEETLTQGCLFPIPPEHIILEIPFYGCVRSESRDEQGRFVGRKGNTPVLLVRCVCSVR